MVDVTTPTTKKKVGGLRNPPGGRPKGVISTPKAAIAKAKSEAVIAVVTQFQAELEARLLTNLRNLGKLGDGFTPEEAKAFGIPPDRYANIYLIDRLLGKPKGDEETKPTGPVTNIQYNVTFVARNRQAIEPGEGSE